MTIRTTGLGDLPRDSIFQPDPVMPPDPFALFARRAERLRVQAVGHPMADWLRFLALIADAQDRAVRDMAGAGLDSAGRGEAGLAGEAPLRAGSVRPGALNMALARIAAVATAPAIPDAARAVLQCLPDLDTDALAAAWLGGEWPLQPAGVALPIAAALQVWFAIRAAALDAGHVPLLARRGLCPVCAGAPVAGVVTAAGKAPGTRYLHCGLCAAAWNHVRAVCTGCGESRGLALQAVEGGSGAIQAETCDACHGYAKMFYQAKDMAIEPFADDLASLGLDLMVSESGWSRLAPNPFLLG